MKIFAAAILVGLPLLAQATFLDDGGDDGLPPKVEGDDRRARSLQASEGPYCSSKCSSSKPCYTDPACLTGKASLGCNATGAGQDCRFCEFGEFADIVCETGSATAAPTTAGTTEEDTATVGPTAAPTTAAPTPQHAWSSYYGYCDPSCTLDNPCFDDTACARVDLGWGREGFVPNANVAGGDVAGCGEFADYSCRSCAAGSDIECGCNGAVKDKVAEINAGGPDGYRAAKAEMHEYVDFAGGRNIRFSTPEDTGTRTNLEELEERCKTDPNAVVNVFAWASTPSWSPLYEPNAATGSAEALCMKGVNAKANNETWPGVGMMETWYEDPAGVDVNSQCNVVTVTCDDVRWPSFIDFDWALEVGDTVPGRITQEYSTGIFLSYPNNWFYEFGWANLMSSGLENLFHSIIKKGTCFLADGRKVAFDLKLDGCDVEYQYRYEGRGSRNDPENPLCIPGSDEVPPYSVKFV